MKVFGEKRYKTYFENTVRETKQDIEIVKNYYDEEGASPAVLHGISGTANVGKNVLKGIQTTSDIAFDYVKTETGADTIISDGIGKTLSGAIGTLGETIAATGSLFSPEEGTTKKALKNLNEEGSKVVEGSKNLFLGITGKGWLWGKKETKEEPSVIPETKTQIISEQKNKIEDKQESFLLDLLKYSVKKETDNNKKVSETVNQKMPDEKNTEDSNELLDTFDDEFQNPENEEKSKQDIKPAEKCSYEQKTDTLNKETVQDFNSIPNKIICEELSPDTIVKEEKSATQKDLKDLLSIIPEKINPKQTENNNEINKTPEIPKKPKEEVNTYQKPTPAKNSIFAIKELLDILEKRSNNSIIMVR